ncbi:hypothetical protein E2C01_039072 [Portunus trituberculatus]|uniref:Uncharacterized protein n=1 Tax=Portunus trituberculatus TaxID=210409 RepID=A0A5B7FLR8_PORTR|nr:hypothetical protein [Portunus trituberculatus]
MNHTLYLPRIVSVSIITALHNDIHTQRYRRRVVASPARPARHTLISLPSLIPRPAANISQLPQNLGLICEVYVVLSSVNPLKLDNSI